MNSKHIITLLVLVVLLLAGCGEPKVGDRFVLKDNISGGYTLNSYEDAVKEVENLGDDFDPEKDFNLVDTSNIDIFNKDDEVEIVDVSKKYNMYQLQHIDPDTGDKIKIWVSQEDLNKAR